MYGHKYRVFLLGEVKPFAPMNGMSFDTVGEALKTARQMFPGSDYYFQAC